MHAPLQAAAVAAVQAMTAPEVVAAGLAQGAPLCRRLHSQSTCLEVSRAVEGRMHQGELNCSSFCCQGSLS